MAFLRNQLHDALQMKNVLNTVFIAPHIVIFFHQPLHQTWGKHIIRLGRVVHVDRQRCPADQIRIVLINGVLLIRKGVRLGNADRIRACLLKRSDGVQRILRAV